MCETEFPDQGSNPGPLYWELRALATGPPRGGPKQHPLTISQFLWVRSPAIASLVPETPHLSQGCRQGAGWSCALNSRFDYRRICFQPLPCSLRAVGQSSTSLSVSWRPPRASLVAQSSKNLPAMQETWVRSLGREDPLEEEMATRSSILAWRISWTEEPGGLQSMGLQESETTWPLNQQPPPPRSNWHGAECLHHCALHHQSQKESLLVRQKVKISAAQSWLTLHDPVDCSPPGCSVHGVLQARTLERVAIPFCRRSSQPRNRTWVSCIGKAYSSPSKSPGKPSKMEIRVFLKT